MATLELATCPLLRPPGCHQAIAVMRRLGWLSMTIRTAYHEIFFNSHEVVVNFHETIQLKALELKQLHRGGGTDRLTEHFLEEALKTPEGQAMTRNICAHISAPLFERVEECCNLLSISKRRFVEMALREAVERAETIVAEVDPFPGEEG